MQIKRSVIAYMSPTGGVKKVADALVLGHKNNNLPYSSFNFLNKRIRSLSTSFGKDDLIFFCFPVYFGRMPWCLKDWDKLAGNGAKAFIVSVYGNRLCEDAPREAADFLKERGFKIVGYAEIVAEHSQERKMAAGRPDLADIREIENIAFDVVNQVINLPDEAEYLFENKEEYRPYGQVPFVPTRLSQNGCEDCKICIKMCPQGIIDPKSREVLPENRSKCMGCRACIAACKNKVRGIPDAVLAKIAEKMAEVMAKNSERKENRYYLAK